MEGYRNEYAQDGLERRLEERHIEETYSSVELSIKNLDYTYQFRIWETSDSGMSILVSDRSILLEYLKTGTILDIKYNPSQPTGESRLFKTEIRHVTRDVDERIKGHCLIGLSIVDKTEIH